MLNTATLFDDQTLLKMSAVINSTRTTFSYLATLAGLSKEFDFIGTDLRGVDFSQSDIRGYNFSGADLSGSMGMSVFFDKTTILDGANVEGSFLEQEVEKRAFLSTDSDHQRLYERLRSDHWANGSIWIAENLKPTSKNFSKTSKLAKYLHSDVKDQTYKNHILYALRNTFNNKSEYRSFLINNLSNPDLTYRSLRGIVDILGKSFRSDEIISDIMFEYLKGSEPEVRRLCFPLVINSEFLRRHRRELEAVIAEETSEGNRRVITKCFCRTVGRYAEIALFNPVKNEYFDYEDEITQDVFDSIIRYAVNNSDLFRDGGNIEKRSGASTNSLRQLSQREYLDGVRIYEPELRKVAGQGLPLRLKYKMPDISIGYRDHLTMR